MHSNWCMLSYNAVTLIFLLAFECQVFLFKCTLFIFFINNNIDKYYWISLYTYSSQSNRTHLTSYKNTDQPELKHSKIYSFILYMSYRVLYNRDVYFTVWQVTFVWSAFSTPEMTSGFCTAVRWAARTQFLCCTVLNSLYEMSVLFRNERGWLVDACSYISEGFRRCYSVNKGHFRCCYKQQYFAVVKPHIESKCRTECMSSAQPNTPSQLKTRKVRLIKSSKHVYKLSKKLELSSRCYAIS